MGNFRLHEFNFLLVYTLAAEEKNQSFQNHLIKIFKDLEQVKWKCCTCFWVVFFIFSYVLFDTTKVQKKGANHGNIPLNLAPESDEWEEIECDEANQNLTTNIHVCPHQQHGSIHSFKVCICQ
jgi:hypothetical protein